MLKPRKSLENIVAYDVPLFEEEWKLKLDANENIFGPSQKVIDAIRNISAKNINYYPVYGELTEKLADFTGFRAENIKVTNGADESIYAILQTYLDVGDKLLVVDPTFAMPMIYAKMIGADIEKVPYKKRWEFPIDDFVSKIQDEAVKVVYISTPNSPTGESISFDDLEKILKVSSTKAVLIDETYGNYCNSNYKEFVRKYDNAFVVKSFSKDFALAGLRLGYIISNEFNIKWIKAVVSPYSVNSVATVAGVAALSDYSYFENIKKEIEKSKKVLTEGFEKLGATVYPTNTNFLCVVFGEKADFIQKKLENEKVIIKRFKDPFGQVFFRITAPRLEDSYSILDSIEAKDTVVFDMDGVLVDASKSYRIAIMKTFEFFAGKEVSVEAVQNAKNMGGLNNDWDLTEFLLNQVNIYPDKNYLIEKFQEFYWADGNGLINNEDLLINKEYLKELSVKYNLAVFTGRPRLEAEFALRKNEIEDYFYSLIAMDDLPLDRQKPDTLGLEIIKDRLITDKVYYIGDTIDDVKVAKNFDAISIGVLPPQDKSEELRKSLKCHGAIIVLDDVNELDKALEI